MTNHFFIVNICSSIFEYSAPLSYISFTHYSSAAYPAYFIIICLVIYRYDIKSEEGEGVL
jgi:hypothetical protein